MSRNQWAFAAALTIVMAYVPMGFGQAPTRALPDCYEPGTGFQVVVSATLTDAPGWGAEETVPTGWTVSNVSDGGTFSAAQSRIRWLSLQVFTGQLALTYTVTPPAGASGTATFAGAISVDGVDTTTAGDAAIDVCAEECAVSLSPSTGTVGADAGNTSVDVTANDAWTASSDAAWATLSASSGSGNGSLSVNYTANSSTSQRTATITVTCDESSATATFTLTQSGSDCAVSLSPTTGTVGADAGNTSVDVMANGAWTASSDAAWATLSASSGSGNGSLSVNYTVNSSTSQRTATITVTCDESSATATFTLTQSGSDCAVSLSPTTGTAGAAAGSASVSVTANGAWTATSSASWATLSAFSGSGNGSLSVNYTANSSTSLRTATITVACNEGSASATFTMTQSGVNCAVSVSPTSQTVGADAGSTSVSVTANGAWTAASSSSWATLSASSGAGNGSLSVSYTANSSTSQRTATITVACDVGGAEATFGVVQAGMSCEISLSPASRAVESPSGSNTFSVASPGPWSAASNSGWATVSPSSGSGNGTVTVNYTENTGATSRSVTLTVTRTDCSGGTASAVLTQERYCPDQPLGTPTNLTADYVENATQISLTWDAVPGAVEYIIYRVDGANSNFDSATLIATVAANSYNDLNVQGGSDTPQGVGCGLPGCQSLGDTHEIGPDYTYWVKAVNTDCGLESELSEPVTGSSWKEGRQQGASADGAVLVAMLLAIGCLARRFGAQQMV